MLFQNNWRYKSIEVLEKKTWPDVEPDESSIVLRLNRLRKTPLNEFSIDDIRFMIGQESGLPFLITIAIEYLREDLYTEGNYYPGNLLGAVLHTKAKYWESMQNLWIEVDSLIKDRLVELREYEPRFEIDNFYAGKSERKIK